MNYRLAELAKLIGASLQGDPECEISGIAPLDSAQPGQISFLSNSQLRAQLKTTRASAVIIAPKDAAEFSANALLIADPYLAYAKIAALFAPKLNVKPGVHPTAIIGNECNISATASIAAKCVLGDRVVIGENVIVGAGCVIGDDSCIEADSVLRANITLYDHVRIGKRVLIHSGVVIGSDGFGFANDHGMWQKIPQLGGVLIANDVEIGANTTIDRGALVDTVIEEGVKLDNLIQVAHNVHIGAHTAIAAGTAIAGSTKIGHHCMIGGATSIVGHIEIVPNVILVGTSVVERSITEPGVYGSGTGLIPLTELKRLVVRYRQLDDFAKRLQKLEKVQNERNGD